VGKYSSITMKFSAQSNLWKEYPQLPTVTNRFKARSQGTHKLTSTKMATALATVVGLFLLISMIALAKMSGIAGLSSPADSQGIHSKMQSLSMSLRGLPHPSPSLIPMTSLIEKLFRIGTDNATELVEILANDDPFGVNAIRDPSTFECPTDVNQRVDFPSLVDDTNAKRFRDNDPDAFIFYQHLRKAGGTGFCELAKSNMERGSVPPYFCMPDNRGSLATPPWSDSSYLLDKLHERGFRMAANEWDAFYDKHATIPGAVLATTFRHPIDRWYSQYRFEHLEHRDGTDADAPRQSFFEYYKGMMGWTMNYNYYVTTFIGTEDEHPPANKGDFYWTYHKFWKKPITLKLFLKALTNVRRFNLVLVTEYLDFAAPMIESVLGWRVPPKQVLPHEVQAVRKEHKNIPASVRMASDKYAVVCRENVFDLLLFSLSKRIFLERLSCEMATKESTKALDKDIEESKKSQEE